MFRVCVGLMLGILFLIAAMCVPCVCRADVRHSLFDCCYVCSVCVGLMLGILFLIAAMCVPCV